MKGIKDFQEVVRRAKFSYSQAPTKFHPSIKYQLRSICQISIKINLLNIVQPIRKILFNQSYFFDLPFLQSILLEPGT